MTKHLLVVLAFLFVTGCTSIQSGFCTAKGGTPHVNLGGYQYCGKAFNDAGNECRDSSECEGVCYLPWGYSLEKGDPKIGYCSSDNIPVNKPCNFLEAGKIEQGMCLEE